MHEAAGEKLCLFRCGDGLYALPHEHVLWEGAPRPVHTIPRRSGRLLRGLVAHEGQLQLCVAMHEILGQPASGIERSMLIIEVEGSSWAFEVDELLGEATVALAGSGADPSRPMALEVIDWQARAVAVLDAHRLHSAAERALRAAEGDDMNLGTVA